LDKNIKTKCGFVAVVGRPNAGKSSLLKRFYEKFFRIRTKHNFYVDV
jgi:GTPase Era involved in 16S rRNA processing